MSRHVSTVPPDYFADLYASNPDPWGFETSAYETEKYDATLASLKRETYPAALEVGCSIGVLTQKLAERCADLLSIDVASSAIETAQARCAGLPQVRFAKSVVPGEWPAGRFDLIMLSEVLYFFTREDLATLVARMRESLNPGGEVVMVHWLGETHYPLSGDVAVEAVIALSEGWLDVVHQTRAPLYRLDVLQARAAASGTR